MIALSRLLTTSLLVSATLAVACGARSGLELESSGEGGGGAAPCTEGEVRDCGIDEGACERGLTSCHDGVFGVCEGEVGPTEEACNGVDDDCDGAVDQPFGVGSACDGPDADQCLDDVLSCDGCSSGDDNVETCNGVDDNCNGVVDADCEVGDCQPTLELIGSVASSSSCVDFPVEAGSTGEIEYPCGGGPVTATLGEVVFTGSVQDGAVSLDGVAQVIGPDGCLWQTEHHIGGTIASGTLTYQYHEHVIQADVVFCWMPCTEYGEVKVTWAVAD